MSETIQLTPEMIWVLGILGLTVFLFVSEIVRVDVAAIVVMVLLGLTGVLPGVPTLVPGDQLFGGFASNAVVSIIAVMIIGAGLDKTGIMGRVAGFILRVGGTTERRIIPLVSGTVGGISSFMQNVGAAALFLPVVSRISARTGLPMSRLLMPMGFTAILGGTMTMIGSSPLILLNDLILTSNRTLPEGMAPMETFGLFDVTPIGLALVATGILYFVIAGRLVLPTNKNEGNEAVDTAAYLKDVYGLGGDIHEFSLEGGSALAGKSVEEIEASLGLPIVAMRDNGTLRIAPARDVTVRAGADLAVMGERGAATQAAERHGLRLAGGLTVFADSLAPTQSGVAEVVIPPASDLAGKTLADLRMRKTYGLNVLAVYRGKAVLREGLRDLELQAGDTLVVHCRWDDLVPLEKDRNFVVVTSDYPHEDFRPHKVGYALAFFGIALGLVLFTDLRLSIALMVGAIGMIVSGVLNIDEAYKSVSWQTVFLLASLIPLGIAVETTGTAAWIAVQTLNIVGEVPTWVLQAVVAILATAFTLVMSNVGATVLLVPLAVNIALQAGANPAIFALTVAIATSNSFLIPTHQVNALIMGPGGYRNADFMRAGGIMTVLFLIVAVTMLNLVF